MLSIFSCLLVIFVCCHCGHNSHWRKNCLHIKDERSVQIQYHSIRISRGSCESESQSNEDIYITLDSAMEYNSRGVPLQGRASGFPHQMRGFFDVDFLAERGSKEYGIYCRNRLYMEEAYGSDKLIKNHPLKCKSIQKYGKMNKYFYIRVEAVMLKSSGHIPIGKNETEKVNRGDVIIHWAIMWSFCGKNNDSCENDERGNYLVTALNIKSNFGVLGSTVKTGQKMEFIYNNQNQNPEKTLSIVLDRYISIDKRSEKVFMGEEFPSSNFDTKFAVKLPATDWQTKSHFVTIFKRN